MTHLGSSSRTSLSRNGVYPTKGYSSMIFKILYRVSLIQLISEMVNNFIKNERLNISLCHQNIRTLKMTKNYFI